MPDSTPQPTDLTGQQQAQRNAEEACSPLLQGCQGCTALRYGVLVHSAKEQEVAGLQKLVYEVVELLCWYPPAVAARAAGAEGDVVQHGHIVAHHRRLANHNACGQLGRQAGRGRMLEAC